MADEYVANGLARRRDELAGEIGRHLMFARSDRPRPTIRYSDVRFQERQSKPLWPTWAQCGRYWTFCLHERDRSNGRLFSTSVAAGSAKREEGSIRPGFVDRPDDHPVGD
jgi:hypothetical protein